MPETKQTETKTAVAFKPIRLRATGNGAGLDAGYEWDEESTDAARMMVENRTAAPATDEDRQNLERQSRQQQREQQEFERKRLEQLRNADPAYRQRFQELRKNKMLGPGAASRKGE